VAATDGPGPTPSGVATTDPVVAHARPDDGGGLTGAVVVVALVSDDRAVTNGDDTSVRMRESELLRPPRDLGSDVQLCAPSDECVSRSAA
jgi:hypothetical protein